MHCVTWEYWLSCFQQPSAAYYLWVSEWVRESDNSVENFFLSPCCGAWNYWHLHTLPPPLFIGWLSTRHGGWTLASLLSRCLTTRLATERSITAAKIWNNLLSEVTSSDCLRTFKTKLKTCVFSSFFPQLTVKWLQCHCHFSLWIYCIVS